MTRNGDKFGEFVPKRERERERARERERVRERERERAREREMLTRSHARGARLCSSLAVRTQCFVGDVDVGTSPGCRL